MRVRVAILLVAVATAVSCSDDDSDDARPAAADEPAATIDGTDIGTPSVEVLATDPAFLRLAGFHEGDDTAPDALAGTEIGRVALTWLIEHTYIANEIERRGLDITDGVERAEEILDDAVTDTDVGQTLHERGELSDAAREALATALGEFLTLDDALRALDPDDPDVVADLRTTHPELAVRACGWAALVEPDDRAAVVDHLDGGGTIETAPDVVEPIAHSGNGTLGTCLDGIDVPHRLGSLLAGVAPTEIGTQTTRITALERDDDVTVFLRVDERGTIDDDAELDEMYGRLAERISDGGVQAWHDATANLRRPDIVDDWGQWDPSFGVVDEQAALPYEILDLPPQQPAPTTAPSTTAAPTTTAPPPPAEPVELVAAEDPGTGDLTARANAALTTAVPQRWRDAVPVRIEVIGGSSSYSYADGLLQFASYHLSGPWNRLQGVAAHEFGHHVAFRYGSQSEFGAAPAGWPISGAIPVEHWADCVARSFTGVDLASHGQAGCVDPELAWTVDYVDNGPAGYQRTG